MRRLRSVAEIEKLEDTTVNYPCSRKAGTTLPSVRVRAIDSRMGDTTVQCTNSEAFKHGVTFSKLSR